MFYKIVILAQGLCPFSADIMERMPCHYKVLVNQLLINIKACPLIKS